MNDFNNDNNDNITFFLEEKNDDKNNEEEIKKLMEEFNDDIIALDDDIIDHFKSSWSYDEEMAYFMYKSKYGNDELFYDQEYTVKDLLKICNYYGLDKEIRTSKCKKQDIIATIVYFESLPENFYIVQQRNRMWAYITELLLDQKMKKFIIWN